MAQLGKDHFITMIIIYSDCSLAEQAQHSVYGSFFSSGPAPGPTFFILPILDQRVEPTSVLSLLPLRERVFIYLGFYVAFNTVQVISRWVVGRAEETSTYSSLGFCTVNCRPMASNYQLSQLRPCRESNPSLRGGRRECYHSATVAPKRKSKAGISFTSFSRW